MLPNEIETNSEYRKVLKLYKNELDYRAENDNTIKEMVLFCMRLSKPYCHFSVIWWMLAIFSLNFMFSLFFCDYDMFSFSLIMIFLVLGIICLFSLVFIIRLIKKHNLILFPNKVVHYYENTNKINPKIFPIMLINILSIFIFIFTLMYTQLYFLSEESPHTFKRVNILINSFSLYLFCFHRIIRPADLGHPVTTLLNVESIEIFVDYFDLTNIFSTIVLLVDKDNYKLVGFILCSMWIITLIYKFLVYFSKIYPYNTNKFFNSSFFISKMQTSYNEATNQKLKYYFCFRNRVRFLISSVIMDGSSFFFRVFILSFLHVENTNIKYIFFLFSIKNLFSIVKGIHNTLVTKRVLEENEVYLRNSMVSRNRDSIYFDEEYNLDDSVLLHKKVDILKKFSLLNITTKILYILPQIAFQIIFCSYSKNKDYYIWYFVSIILFFFEIFYCIFSYILYKKTVELPDNGISCFLILLCNCFPLMTLYIKVYFIFFFNIKVSDPSSIFDYIINDGLKYIIAFSHIFYAFTGKLNCWWICLSRSAEYFITDKKFDLNWNLFKVLIDSIIFVTILDVFGCINLLSYENISGNVKFVNFMFAIMENFSSYFTICVICFLYYYYLKNYFKFKKLYYQLRIFLLILNFILFIWRVYIIANFGDKRILDYFIFKNLLQILYSVGAIQSYLTNQIYDDN